MRWLPRTLGGQLAVLLIGALVLAQAVSLALLAMSRADAVRSAGRTGLLDSMSSVMRVLSDTPADARAALAEAATTPRIRYWVSEESTVAEPAAASRFLSAPPVLRMFGADLPEPPRVAIIDDGGSPALLPRFEDKRGPVAGPPADDGRRFRFEEHRYRLDERYDVLASVPFADGSGWLNAQTRIRAEPVEFPWPSVISSIVMAVAILVIVGFVVRRATRPIAVLADGVEAFGRGGPSRVLPEAGPSEVRRLTAAFNRMQERLERFIADRTRMLGAIGHDLRTPITSLKLRAELLDDEEARTRMMATLDDMQRMTEATLAFARDDSAAEPVRTVDLAALVESLAEDVGAFGSNVAFEGPGRLPYPCRPTALRRAIRNLVENAVRYGKRARIALASDPAGPVVTIDDDGPGIPPDRLDDVFKPFVRLETSRSRETGGVGLGLAIARSIVLAHGGDLMLANRDGGGLRAEVRLPKVVVASL